MNLRQCCGTPSLKVGHFLFEFATPGIGFIVKQAGVDFLVIDMEHSGFGFETIRGVILSCRAAGVPGVVRVPSRDYKDLARACDAGAEGIMVPMVASPEEASEIVRAVKYYPEGARGASLGMFHTRYALSSFADEAKAANDRIAVFAQIESVEGVSNADAIAAVEGIDCLWLGHLDLSCSLGIPTQYDNPTFLNAVSDVLAATSRHGKSAGRMVRNAEEGAAQKAQGFDFIALGSDVQTLIGALRSGVEGLRKQAAGAPT